MALHASALYSESLARTKGSGSNSVVPIVIIVMNFGTDVRHLHQMSLLIFQRSGSKFKVKTAILKIFCLQ